MPYTTLYMLWGSVDIHNALSLMYVYKACFTRFVYMIVTTSR